jgi:hypothetical protein
VFYVGHVDKINTLFHVILSKHHHHLGPQSRLNVTIFDDDLFTIDAKFTRPLNRSNTVTATAGFNYSITIQAALSYERFLFLLLSSLCSALYVIFFLVMNIFF